MSKGSMMDCGEIRVFVGVDVSAATLAVAVLEGGGEACGQREFPNVAAGFRQMIAWLRKRGGGVRVTLEATGTYSLNVSLALDEAEGVEVAVLNPLVAHQFAKTLRRSKTDAADAAALAEYSLRMKFVPWPRPSQAVLALRAISRYLAGLSGEHTRLRNRLHAADGSVAAPRCVREDLRRSMAGLEKRMVRLRREAVALIEADAVLARKYRLLVGMPGIAEVSAVQLLGELAGMDPEMTVRQWVASSGLDPVQEMSGSSVRKKSRISRKGNRYLRRALYMPALSAARWDPHLKAFYVGLQARRKTKLQALIAVARKMLHAIFGIFRTDTAYDGARLFPALAVA